MGTRDLRQAVSGVLLLCAGLSLSQAVDAKAQREAAQRAAFVKAYPCPATGKPRGACPGYVEDHTNPLGGGGADRQRNMKGQRVSEAKRKDGEGRAACAPRPRPRRPRQ